MGLHKKPHKVAVSWGNMCLNIFINILKLFLQPNMKPHKLSKENRQRLLASSHKRGNTNDK